MMGQKITMEDLRHFVEQEKKVQNQSATDVVKPHTLALLDKLLNWAKMNETEDKTAPPQKY